MFNFKQRALLTVPMDWKRRYTPSVEALALNILLPMHYSERRLRQPLKGAGFVVPTTALVVFARDHLLSMERDGGHIPRDQIVAWCSWHLPTASHRSNTSSSGRSNGSLHLNGSHR